MKHLGTLILCGAITFLVVENTVYAEEVTGCVIIRMPIDQRVNRIEIDKPGHYCVRQNVTRGKLFDMHSSSQVRGTYLGYVATPNVDLNLAGNELYASGPMIAGILETAPTSMYSPVFSKLAYNVRIHNGVIKLKDEGYGIVLSSLSGLYSVLVNPISVFSDTQQYFYQYPERKGDEWYEKDNLKKFSKTIESLPKAASGYPSRNLRIQNMQIHTKDVGIVLQGAGNVIRDSRIEVEGGTAIWIYGPNSVIENNTIIVHCNHKPLEADAPIRLHHGDGTIIRNNRIIVKNPAPKRVVSVADTGAIEFEGNVFYGLSASDELVKAFSGQATFRTKDNKFEASWKSR